MEIRMQKLPRPDDVAVWNPVIPEYYNEDGNAGIDFHSAVYVVADEVGISSRLPLGYMEITGATLDEADISTLSNLITDENSLITSSLIANFNENNVRIEYDKNSPRPLRMYSAIVRTGLRVELPERYHMRIASRSGLGFKRNIFAFPGTIDNSYRGELIIKLYQFTDDPEPFVITPGERIAQGILFTTPEITITEAEVSTATRRGEGGFGSTGA